jgi:hypothetical protein
VRRLHFLTLAALMIGGSRTPAAELRASTITVHVHRNGLFFSRGGDYTMVAPVASSLFVPEQQSVDILVHAKDVAVTDPAVSAVVRHEIENTMRGPRVLDSAAFPEIHFTAGEVEETAPDQYRITGRLQLHGVEQQLVFNFDGDATHYHGHAQLHPSDFGIASMSFAGGLVRIKDEIDLEFDLFRTTEPPPAAGDHNPE